MTCDGWYGYRVQEWRSANAGDETNKSGVAMLLSVTGALAWAGGWRNVGVARFICGCRRYRLLGFFAFISLLVIFHGASPSSVGRGIRASTAFPPLLRPTPAT